MSALLYSARALPLVAALVLLIPACTTHSEHCETLCKRFVNDCQFSAWSNVSQCTQGCVDDMYRRDDAQEVFDCYRAAIAPPSREQAAITVQRAVDAGLFSKDQEVGLFDLDAAIDAAIEHGTCDPFAAVQCKVQALKQPPTGLFISE